MPSILLNSTHITTEKLLPMVEATTKAAAVVAIPITKTTSTIITNLSQVSSNSQNKRPTIIIYPTGELFLGMFLSSSWRENLFISLSFGYFTNQYQHFSLFIYHLSDFYAESVLYCDFFRLDI